MDDLNTTLLAALEVYGPLALAVTILLGSMGVPLPITFVLFAAGALARQGLIEPKTGALLALTSAVLGDFLGYSVGRGAGRLMRHSFDVRAPRAREEAPAWRQARVTFARWGGWSIFLTRWLLTPLALPTNFLAGSGRYPRARFLFFSSTGEATWVVLYGSLGYLSADRWQAMQAWTTNLTRALALFVVVAVACAFLLRRLRGQATRAWGRIILGALSKSDEPQWRAAFRLKHPDRWRQEVLRYLDHPLLLAQPTTFELSLPSTPGSEKLARHTVAWVGLRLDLTVERIADLQTAVSEAFINAVEHGNQGNEHRRVQVIFSITPEHLEVEVSDEGVRRFEQPVAPPATIEEKLAGLAPLRGMGLMLIRQLVDEAEFGTGEDGVGNRVRLRMRRPPLAESSAPGA